MKKLTQKKLKSRKKNFAKPALASMAVASAMAVLTYDARANVYATDILVNGTFPPVGSVAAALSSPVSISYRLNQPATLGVTVFIMQGNTIVASIPGGTAMGLNTVSWTPSSTGTYSISITAAAADVSGGTTNWTQISVDSTNTAMVYPQGIDVDKNTNSAYYGRVVVGNAIDASANGVTQKVGLYKFNADGSAADEGSFGYAGYTTNDAGNIGTNEMSQIGSYFGYHNHQLPYIIRIAADDRIYFLDQTEAGAIIATDMQATTNQLVINEGSSSPGYPGSLNNYSGNPDFGLLNQSGQGWGQFDVAGFETGHPALYLDDKGDYPTPGIWMYHITNGVADPADVVGTQCVAPDGVSLFVTGSGISVDTNLDIFFGQNRSGNPADPLTREFSFTNWNGGCTPAGRGRRRRYLWTAGLDNAGLGGGRWRC